MTDRPLSILAVYGTRPEAIKMAPVIAALRRRPDRFALTVCATGQHRDMVAQVEELLGLAPDLDLRLMQPDQGLNSLASAALAALDRVLAERRPDWLLVQGDTTTAMTAALAAFHRGLRVGHVEAGLRTGDLRHPFPEEANRRVIDLVADALFAPTELAARALLAEGCDPARVHVVGNTVIDALEALPADEAAAPGRPEVLITVHRRESFGAPLAAIFAALRELAGRFPQVTWVYPVHRNPNVLGPARERLGGLSNLELHEPFDYLELVRRLRRCRLVLTDSGGIQEEAPTFGKPVLVLRDTTERPEGVAAGVARLVGTDRERIVAEAARLLTSEEAWQAMARAVNPYGDGRAAERIAAILAGEPWTPFQPVEQGVALAASTEAALAGRLAEAERELAERQRRLDALERRERGLQAEVANLHNTLLRIYHSRLWRTADVFWRVRRRLLKALGRSDRGGSGPAPAPAAEAAGEEEHAPSVPAVAPSRAGAFDVVFFPIVEWGFRFQRPQQLASRFAAAGHRVFYLRLTFRPEGPPYRLEPVAENLWEVSLAGPPLSPYADGLDRAAEDRLFAGLDALRRDAGLGATAAMVELPFWGPLALRAWRELAWPVVYDCMDDHAGFATNGPRMLRQEEELLRGARLVLASSRLLAGRCARTNPEVLPLPNACDFEHFAAVATPRGERERPVVGYYGAIADWFDAGLVAELARRRPGWGFVLVGAVSSPEAARLGELPNVALPGERPYAELPGWLEGFDALILPFRRTPLTAATNPVKVYEILAAGKPLVAVPLPELESLQPLVRLAGTPGDFLAALEEELAGDGPERVAARRAFARGETWQARFETLAPRLARAFPLASVAIVTRDNLALNRLCLESLFADTEWPNLEVLVVDNASTDGTRDLLAELAARAEGEEDDQPRLRVTLADANLGFAAATNLALAEARGSFLVLLNNDTVVPRGCLAALIRHLQRDPGLGLLCPSTNAIANQARVDVGYQRVEDMPEWAAGFVRANDGLLEPLPAAAMFCLALRRDTWERIGPLDERFEVGMFEDDDYSLRARQLGLQVACTRDAFVHHWQGASFRRLEEREYLRLYEANRRRFEEKWARAAGEGERGAARPAGAAEVAARVAAGRGAVVFLPSIGWGVHLVQRPHHLARAFAELGFVSVFDCSNAPREMDDVDGFREVEPGVFLFRGPIEELHGIPGAVLWTFPYNAHLAEGFPEGTATVYDWIDDLSVFPHDQRLLERNHRRALRRSTVVACVARRLLERAAAVRPDALYLPNAVEYERFAGDPPPLPAEPELAALLATGRPVAGYYGALARWFDYRLLEEAARLRPDWSFLLIGPDHDRSVRRARLPRNVLWLGPRDYRSLPAYLARFDVATIPFVIDEITLATSPLKLYEYFAGGKPVVATPMPECAAYPEVTIAATPAEFAAALDRARERGAEPDFRARLRELARASSWRARAEEAAARLALAAGAAPARTGVAAP